MCTKVFTPTLSATSAALCYCPPLTNLAIAHLDCPRVYHLMPELTWPLWIAAFVLGKVSILFYFHPSNIVMRAFCKPWRIGPI